MQCEVEFTDEFEDWWNGLSEHEQESVDSRVDLLERLGGYVGLSLFFGYSRTETFTDARAAGSA